MTNLKNKEFTFWNLISKYVIEIPAIQRDYVQDRLYSDLKKEECDIVGDIANSLTNNIKINLHFVYGKVDNEELIPLDGQQRLTTLFLTHWFLSLGTLTDDNKNILSKFTYETRPSSEDFCMKLVKESIVFQNDIKISQQIVNSKWFFLSWKNDPTIQAMLNMLDVIQTKFIQPNEGLFNLFCNENCPVIFHFLPLEQFKLDDEIYVKMNSRGKPLTDFENFKANFSVLFGYDNKSKLDNEWLDIFWKFEKDNDTINLKEVDRRYLDFLKNSTLNFIAETKDIDRLFKDKFNIFVEYKNVYSKNFKTLQQFSKILDCLTSFNDDNKYFESILTDNPNYWERTRFYALSQFFIQKGKLDNANQNLFDKWMRVCTNLINNTRIEDPELFYKAIRSIKELSSHIDDLYDYLSKTDTKIDLFEKEQCEEEKIKAKLMLDDKSNQWSEAIEKIEHHSYFNGQIGFILNFTKTNTDYDIDKFLNYSEKMNRLFSSEFQDKYDCLFQRALLTFGDYLVYISNHYTFCKFENNLRAKMDNWRKVFNDDTKNNYLKQLLDAIKIDSIKNDLQTIVNDFQEDENDWMSLFIKNKGIIEYCCDKYSGVKNYQIDKIGEQIYLARSNANSWKRKAELRSYVFYKTKLESKESTFNPFEQVWYSDSSDYTPCAVIDLWDYQSKYSFVLDISYSDNKFSLIFFDRNGNVLPVEIVRKLNQKDFTSNIGKNDEDVEVIKSCTYKINGNIGFMKVEQTIKDIFKM
jgi:hypothetical protein